MPEPGSASRSQSIAGQGLAMVVVAIVAMVPLVAVSLINGTGRRWDRQSMLAWAYDDIVIRPLGAAVSPGAVAVAIILLMGVALMRRQPVLALAVAVLVGGATVTTQVLKTRVLAPLAPGENTLPSGHMTVATSLLLAAVLVTSPRWQPVGVPATAFMATICGLGAMIGTWHVPGDVVAAVLVCLAWAGICLALIGILRRGPHAAPAAPRWAGYRPGLWALGGALGGYTVLATYRLNLDFSLWTFVSRLVGLVVALVIAAVVGWLGRVLERG